MDLPSNELFFLFKTVQYIGRPCSNILAFLERKVIRSHQPDGDTDSELDSGRPDSVRQPSRSIESKKNPREEAKSGSQRSDAGDGSGPPIQEARSTAELGLYADMGDDANKEIPLEGEGKGKEKTKKKKKGREM
jgi:hypothetical protein